MLSDLIIARYALEIDRVDLHRAASRAWRRHVFVQRLRNGPSALRARLSEGARAVVRLGRLLIVLPSPAFRR